MSAKRGPGVLVISVIIVLSTALSPPLMRMLGPDLWQGFGLSQQGWSLMKAVTGFALVLFILASGVLADMYGRRRVLTILLAGQVLMLAIGVIVPTKQGLVTLLSGLAVSGAMIQPLVITLLIVNYSGRERVIAITIFAAASGLAVILIPIIDTLILSSNLAWIMFVPPLVLAALGMYLLRMYIPEPVERNKFSWINVAVVAVWAAAVCSLAYGLLLMVGLGVGNMIALAYLIAGLVGVGLVQYFEKRPLSEDYRFEIHRERTLTIAIFSGIVLALTLSTVSAHFYYFFKDIQDAGPVVAGLRLLPIFLGAFLLGALAARITERQGDRIALALGLLVLGFAAATLSILEPDIPYYSVAPILLICGFGYVLGSSPRVLMLSRSVPSQLESTVQAIGVATSQVGAAMAYSMTLGLITFFTKDIYAGHMAAAGLNQDVIESQLVLVEVVTNATRGAVPPEQQAAAIAAILPAYELAHTEAVARMLIVIGFICWAAAAIVYFGATNPDDMVGPLALPPDDTVEHASSQAQSSG